MIHFIFKGLIRDRHRSLFPILIVMSGVMLTVLLHCWINGVVGDMIDTNAKFSTGHVKVVTRAYAENIDQRPNDLAILEVSALLTELKKNYPNMTWVKRIQFGGLLDAPDDKGETKSQGPVIGIAVDLFSENSHELERLQIDKALKKGSLPKKSGEILISDEFAARLEVGSGDKVTLLSSTMYGGLVIYNFEIAGTVQFGITMMDKGAIITDISDAQAALDMVDASSEILGFIKGGFYDDEIATEITNNFNKRYEGSDDEFAPIMIRLKDQNNLEYMMSHISRMIGIFIFIFVFAMSVVLWNAGLLGGLRRYGEIGVRLAIGENKGHVYRSVIYESIMIGIVGTIFGTAVGLGFSYLLQVYGIDWGDVMKNTTMMISTTFRAKITTPAFYIGFIPGVFSTVLGTMLSGIGIYRRKTAQLFKELET